MIQFMCIVFPAVISVWVFEAISKTKLDLKGWIYRFATNALITNMAVLLLKKFVSHTSSEFLAMPGADMVPEVAIRYVVMALPIALAVAVVSALLPKALKVSVEDDQKEDGKEKNE